MGATKSIANNFKEFNEFQMPNMTNLNPPLITLVHKEKKSSQNSFTVKCLFECKDLT